VAAAGNGKFIVTMAREGDVRLWDTASGQAVKEFQPLSIPGLATIAVAPDGKNLAAGGGLRIWRDTLGFEGQVAIRRLDLARHVLDASLAGVIGALAWSPDGKWLAAASTNNSPERADEAILIIDTTTGDTRARLSNSPASIKTVAIAFSPDGRTLFSLAADKQLTHWDRETAQAVQTFEIRGHRPEKWQLHDAAFTPDGKLVATCTLFGEALIVSDVASGQQVCTIQAADTLGNRLAVSLDGRILASACQPITSTDTLYDERIHLWDIATGRELLSFDAASDGTVASLAFLPDGKTLVSGMDRGTALLWDVSQALQTK
jgi:WD40 repeat protein